MTFFRKRILFSLIVLLSCGTPEKRAADDSKTADTTAANQAATKSEKTTTNKRPDSISVALLFINDYVKHIDSPDPFDPMSWVENNELATDEFKAAYKAIIAQGLKDEPETGLSYDPILNAQDYPVSFEFARLDESEFVVVKGTDQPQFLNVLRTKFVIDRWVVDGCGVVNIPEEKRKLLAEDDCVFDNNFRGLTQDWMKELKIINFTWVDTHKHAAVPRGQDTVFAAQGGCEHFNISLEKKYVHNKHALSDSAFWINEALKLAEEFKMDHYKQMIRAGKLTKSRATATFQFYEIEDDDENDNLYYNGIGLREAEGEVRLEMTQYYN